MKDEKLSKLILSVDSGEDPNFWGPADFVKDKNDGLGNDARLCLDVAETESELIVVAAMAGTEPNNLELHLHNDLLTIRGQRMSPIPFDSEHHSQETFWGKFSRTIVLPSDVKAEMAKAEYKNGILVVRLPKTSRDRSIPIIVTEE